MNQEAPATIGEEADMCTYNNCVYCKFKDACMFPHTKKFHLNNEKNTTKDTQNYTKTKISVNWVGYVFLSTQSSKPCWSNQDNSRRLEKWEWIIKEWYTKIKYNKFINSRQIERGRR